AIDADFIAHGHPFLMAAVGECLTGGHTARIRLDYTASGRRLHGLDGVAGLRGIWVHFKLTFRSFDCEESLVSIFLTQRGAQPPDFVSRMVYYPLTDHPTLSVPCEGALAELQAELTRQAGQTIELLSRLNREVFEEEAAKIDIYFEDSLMELE